jgi:hypothetical protein
MIFPSKSQPSFNKDFKRLIDNVKENQINGISTLITSDSLKQLNRLESIFEEIDFLHIYTKTHNKTTSKQQRRQTNE